MLNTNEKQKGATELKSQLDSDLALPRAILGIRSRKNLVVLKDPLVEKARLCAHKEFIEHKRKGPKDLLTCKKPYVVHLEDVAQILAEFGYDKEVIAAGYLHDHVEDLSKRGWTEERVKKEFGARVALLVSFITQQDKSLPWDKRQDAYNQRLKNGPDDAIAISLVDKVSNIRDLIFWMQRGYKVEDVISKNWSINSKKFHDLSKIYADRLPPRLVLLYLKTLREFDRLGKGGSYDSN